jgi:hypothetical protein
MLVLPLKSVDFSSDAAIVVRMASRSTPRQPLDYRKPRRISVYGKKNTLGGLGRIGCRRGSVPAGGVRDRYHEQ